MRGKADRVDAELIARMIAPRWRSTNGLSIRWSKVEPPIAAKPLKEELHASGIGSPVAMRIRLSAVRASCAVRAIKVAPTSRGRLWTISSRCRTGASSRRHRGQLVGWDAVAINLGHTFSTLLSACRLQPEGDLRTRFFVLSTQLSGHRAQ